MTGAGSRRRGGNPTFIIVLLIVAAGALAAVAWWLGGQPKTQELWFRPSPASLPADVAAWARNSLPLYAGQALARGEATYVLVGWGEQPEGAKVEIVGVDRTSDEPAGVRVTVRFTPAPPGPSSRVSTPQDLVVVRLRDAKVEWLVEGDPNARVPLVLAPVEPIVAGSRWIKLFTPAPGGVVTSGFRLSGLANVFEGTVNYRLVLGQGDGTGSVVGQGFATGAMGDWGRFETAVTFPREAAGQPATLEVFWISPADGSEQDLFRVPLTLGSAG